MGVIGKLLGFGVSLAYNEGKKLLSEKELIKNMERISNKELKAHMKQFENYQLKRIYSKADYPKRMKKMAQNILLDRGTLIVDLDGGSVAWATVKNKK